ncbi:LysR family transcriptional regulator [Kerstersia gyiorum]|uniref:LysR family transcriptional regulator n=2 Tax=Kerstersia gyiorum TaxID=206506 RepID=A0A4Q7MB09_9BURK|nr:LysR family transcriptional regulator [Kerstersia gyiorum]RZS64931.1 LysR family transcriptional regulator [Kerstersia gyiorum]
MLCHRPDSFYVSLPMRSAPHSPASQATHGTPTLLPMLRSLRAMSAVVQHGTTFAAAEACHVSQPAITRAIQRLERDCGLDLFLRTARGMAPTEPGRQMAARVMALLACLQTGAREALASDASKRGGDGTTGRFARSVTPSQIQALLSVAAWGSESRAAQALGISQPAIHAALQGLERLISVRLFYKLPSGTWLTPPGDALLLRTRQALAELRGLESDLAAWQGETRGTIVIGTLPLSVPIFLPHAIQTIMQAHPGVRVGIIDGTYEDLLQRLRSADIDVIAGALRRDPVDDDIRQIALFEDDLVIVARPDHPCLQQAGLQLDDLTRWRWVTPLPDTPADRLLRQIFAAQGLAPPSGRLYANSPMITQALVQQTGHLAIASRGQAQIEARHGNLCIVPVATPGTGRKIGLALRTATQASPQLHALLQACQDAVAAPGSLPAALRADGSARPRC